MVLFFQFDIRPEFGLPFATGSHLSMFMSPGVNEIPTFEVLAPGQQLPERFWKQRAQHFAIYLHAPGFEEQPPLHPDQHLDHRQLVFEPKRDMSAPGIYVGGEPNWLQGAEEHVGPRGEPLALICQVTENYGFRKRPEARSQPDSFSAQDYCLFLGNQVYIFGVVGAPEPDALWVTVQN